MTAEDTLKLHNIRLTQHRIEVLSVFMKADRAFSHGDLTKIFSGTIDRVSIYRILNSFLETHLLCKIIDSTGKVSYAFDQHKLHSEGQFHPHFKCTSCHSVLELPKLPDSYLTQLKQLRIDHISVLAEGVCRNCDNREISI